MSAQYTCEMNVSDAQLTGADRRLPVRLKRLHYQQRSAVHPLGPQGEAVKKKKLITSMKTDAKESREGGGQQSEPYLSIYSVHNSSIVA